MVLLLAFWLPAGQSVEWKVVLNNTGTVQLRTVQISTELATVGGLPNSAGLGSFSCTVDDAAFTLGDNLPVGKVAVCVATYAFTQVDAIEQGDLTLAANATAAGVVLAAALNQEVTVVNSPAVMMSIDMSTAACLAPSPNFARK